MRIDATEHTKQDWIAHGLMSDFKIEDVWQLPVELQPNHDLSVLQGRFSNALSTTEGKGLPGKLFQFRMFLGRVFNWDDKADQSSLIPGSIRERYANAAQLNFDDLPAPGNGDFTPVYQLENESLLEIENATVHAAIHLGRVKVAAEKFTVYMTIYVKAKGLFGQAYMLLIKPFRLLIIYPAMLRAIKVSWDRYLEKSKAR